MVYDIFCDERITKYMLFNTIVNSFEILLIHFQQHQTTLITISIGK